MEHDCRNCEISGKCTRHPSMKKVGRLLQICRGENIPKHTREKYLALWDERDGNTPGKHTTVSNLITAESVKKPAYLGDVVSGALSMVGITKKRINKFLGKECGCKARQEKLNAIDQWARKVTAGTVTSSKQVLLGIMNTGGDDSFVWSYGVTTVPQRFGKELDRTLDSLKTAGFDTPILFVDGPQDKHDYTKFGLPVVHRESNMQTNAHWYLTAAELYVREPNADFYGLFQDDFVTYENLRKYIENTEYPENGYLNLYTFPMNQKIADRTIAGETGWFKSNQKGKGAVALVFSNEALRTILSQSVLINGLQGKYRNKKIDGAIIESMKPAGWFEYTHSPSLVQHTGHTSSMRNKKSPQAIRFRGEEYDATLMLK